MINTKDEERKIMDLMKKSIDIIKENQHSSGSFIACPNFENYFYCWLRDGSFIANSLDIVDESKSSLKFFNWVDRVINKQENKVLRLINKLNNHMPVGNGDFLPTRFTLEGNVTNDEWPNFQLDGYGTWIWALCEHIKYSNNKKLINKYSKSIKITIEYLLNFWSIPNYDCWEENGDKINPTTLSCIYGGLKSISTFINDKRISGLSKKIRNYVLKKCIIDGRLSKFEGSKSIDASLLWTTVPFGMFDVRDKIIIKTISEIENKLYWNGGVHRYPEDSYYGGGEWPLLSCWLGLYYLETGEIERAEYIIRWVENQANHNGEIPEQVLDHTIVPEYIIKWTKEWGEVATPLLWSHAMYLILKKKYEDILSY